MYKKFITPLILFSSISVANAEKLESIFIAPDVFISSKIKPTTEYESDRGNILFEGHDIETSRKYSKPRSSSKKTYKFIQTLEWFWQY